MKIAFLFPGQGSQAVGMGRSLAETSDVARRVFDRADDVLGFPLSKLCFEGPEERLKLTENTQPALLTVSIAAYEVLKEQGIEPNLVAGHSLGEYSALVAAGSIDFEDALRLVRRRGQLMQEAVPEGVGAMAALLRLPAGKLEKILAESCADGEMVSAANYNSPDQIVIAGHRPAVERAMERAKAAGARKAVLLPVSAPFHCDMMRLAQQGMRPELDSVEFHDLRVPLINNWQAHATQRRAEVREGLYQQIPGPVRWTESMLLTVRMGAQLAIEVGSGGVLTGLAKQIAPELKCVRFNEAADLEKVKGAISSIPAATSISSN